MKHLNPADYGLNSRTMLQEIDEETIAIVKLIKSRIIRKDAEKLVQMAAKIQTIAPDKQVVLVCTPNICSKSKALLTEHGIGLQIKEKFT